MLAVVWLLPMMGGAVIALVALVAGAWVGFLVADAKWRAWIAQEQIGADFVEPRAWSEMMGKCSFVAIREDKSTERCVLVVPHDGDHICGGATHAPGSGLHIWTQDAG